MSSLPELCATLLRLKDQNKSIETQIETTRQAILHILDEKNLDQYTIPGYTITKKIVRQKRLTKDLVPAEIYDKYAKSTVMTQLEVLPEEKVEQRKQRLARSPRRYLQRSPTRTAQRQP
jgi:hypothetical protein